jgi:hypothetical protein
MPNRKTDSQGLSTENGDKQRDLGAKGGPATGIGNAKDSHRVAAPYNEDLQTQIAAKGKKHKPDKDKEKKQTW